MTWRPFTIFGVVIAVSLCGPAAAKDSIRWTLGKKAGQPHLNGMSTEEEADTEFWAVCKSDGKVDIGVGANSSVGKGEGEAVSLTLTSGAQSATLKGKSQKSANFEMTAGSELRAQISVSDRVFAVLATGAPIAVTGSMEKPATWPVAGLKPKVAAFLAACKK